MSKKHARKQKQVSRARKARTAGDHESETSTRRPRQTVKVIISGISVIVTMLGLLSLLDYLPRLTVESSNTLDPCNPLATVFRLKNEGVFPVGRIRYSFAILDLLSSGNNLDVSVGGRNFHVTDGQEIPFLRRDEKKSLVCPSAFSALAQDTRRCEIEIVVEYHPFMLPVKKEQRYRFEAIMDADRHWLWKEKAASELY